MQIPRPAPGFRAAPGSFFIRPHVVLRYQQAWGTASLEVTTPNLKKVNTWGVEVAFLLPVGCRSRSARRGSPTPGDQQGSSKSEHARQLAQTRPQDHAPVTCWAGRLLVCGLRPGRRGGAVGAPCRNTDSGAAPPGARTFGIGTFNRLLQEYWFNPAGWRHSGLI